MGQLLSMAITTLPDAVLPTSTSTREAASFYEATLVWGLGLGGEKFFAAVWPLSRKVKKYKLDRSLKRNIGQFYINYVSMKTHENEIKMLVLVNQKI